MSVSASTSRTQFNCNGSLQDFPFLFGIQQTSDIKVVLTDSNGLETVLTETTHYTVSAVNDDYESGGTVSTVDTYATGYTITLVRNVPLTQESDYVEGMPTLYETFEDCIDKLTMIAQQTEEKLGRQLVVPISEPSTISRELPSATTRANKLLGFNDDGEPVAVTEIEGSVSLTTFSNALLTTDDAEEARTLLETYSETEIDNAIETSNLLEFTNLNIAATVSAKALTVALKGVDGNDPSATNKVVIPFRSATLTSGIITARGITSALSVTLSSGSTLGFTAAETGRLYVWAIDNAGTVELALSRTADIFQESNLVSTTAEGGAGAADSASVMYSTTARTNVACRCIGYIEITTGATAGEWDNAPTKLQVMGPGVKRTGDIVQTLYTKVSTIISVAVQIPYDNTKPQITEGVEILTQAITPTSAINLIETEARCNFSMAGSGMTTIALFNTDVDASNALTVNAQVNRVSGDQQSISIKNRRVAGVTTATTERVRLGQSAAGAFYVNGDGLGSHYYADTWDTYIKVTEVMA